MAIDKFALCPGGTGKKIKFCHNECVSFLEKVQKLMDGQQLRAALQLVDQTLARDPNRACAWSYKCLLERATGDVEQFAKAAEEFSQRFSSSPVALAEQSLSHIFQGRVYDAIESLSRSIEASHQQKLIYVRQSAAAATISEALVQHQQVPPAVEILKIFGAMSPNTESPVADLWNQVATLPDVILEFREMQWDGLFESERYRPLMEVTDRLAVNLRWRELENYLKEYLNREPEDARVWHFLGVVQMWLMNYEGAKESFARAGKLEKNDRLSVFSLCRSLFFSMDSSQDGDKVCRVELVVDDPNRLKEAILSDRQVLSQKPASDEPMSGVFPFDEDEEVRPELVLAILRRPLPDGQRDGSRLFAETGDTPVLAYASYYGKQTDRPARLLFNDVYESDLEPLKEMVKKWLDRESVEWSVEAVRWKKDRLLKSFVDAESLQNLDSSINCKAEWKKLILEWVPQMRFNCLENVPLAEAAKDPEKRRWVMAILISLKSRLPARAISQPIDELWQQLGLAFEEDLQVELSRFRRLPLSLVRVLELSQLNTETLARFYALAMSHQEFPLLLQLAREVIRRKDQDAVPPALVRSAYFQVIEHLSDVEEDRDECTRLITEAIDFLQKHNLPHGTVHIWEFRLGLRRDDEEVATSLLRHMVQEHENEEEVMQFVRQFWSLINYARSMEGTGVRLPAAGGSSNGEIWTPDAHTGGAAPQKKLWVPGAD
ncbi:MAG: tetratricopeptide repeat protein [Thermogutta sp.]